ncbi:polyphosphate kinase 1 [Sphingobacterium spiritivorum]
MSDQFPVLNRELSWLQFNERVLQEAADDTVPLLERLRFLAIYSSNLSEFYSVRVAILHRMVENELKNKKIGFKPKKVLKQIQHSVLKLDKKFDYLFDQVLMKRLEEENINILEADDLRDDQREYLHTYFQEEILKYLIPIWVNDQFFPNINGRSLHFIVKLSHNDHERISIIEMPKNVISRFHHVPNSTGQHEIILLDEIIMMFLEDIYTAVEFDEISGYRFQITRDSELDLDVDRSDKFLEVLKKSLIDRQTGKVIRLEYDANMPPSLLSYLDNQLEVDDDGFIPMNRYMIFSDFINFPIGNRSDLAYEPVAALPVSGLDINRSLFKPIKKRDYLIHLPYQSYDYVLHFIRESAIDPTVEEINITLYRVANNSNIMNALIIAAKNGKRVNAFLEVKARFDEKANIYWLTKLEEAGVNVFLGNVNIKLHAKSCLVFRREGKRRVAYTYLSTGNFNEKTARIYCDIGLFTSNKLITRDLKRLFTGLKKSVYHDNYKSLITAPLAMRDIFYTKVDHLIKLSQQGIKVSLILKMNSLTDEDIIQRLYQANNAGVKINLIIRGMCCLIPGKEGFSEHIHVTSIVDRYLEHARVWIFDYGDTKEIYLSSADLMTRNLNRRVEIAFPIENKDLIAEVYDLIKIQLSDNTKARIIDAQQKNRYKRSPVNASNRAQVDTYNYLKNKIEIL